MTNIRAEITMLEGKVKYHTTITEDGIEVELPVFNNIGIDLVEMTVNKLNELYMDTLEGESGGLSKENQVKLYSEFHKLIKGTYWSSRRKNTYTASISYQNKSIVRLKNAIDETKLYNHKGSLTVESPHKGISDVIFDTDVTNGENENRFMKGQEEANRIGEDVDTDPEDVQKIEEWLSDLNRTRKNFQLHMRQLCRRLGGMASIRKKKESAKKVVESHKGKNKRACEFTTIRNFVMDGYISHCYEMMACAVGIATGRRCVEVVNNADFTVCPDDSSMLEISGLAKTKIETRSITIKPMFLSPEKVVSLVERIRNHPIHAHIVRDVEDNRGLVHTSDNEIINNRIASRLQTFLSKKFPSIVTLNGKPCGFKTPSHHFRGIEFKVTRDIFAELSYAHHVAVKKTMCKETTTESERQQDEKTVWIQKALGHYEVKTSLNYMKLHLKTPSSYKELKDMCELDDEVLETLWKNELRRKEDLEKYVGQQVEQKARSFRDLGVDKLADGLKTIFEKWLENEDFELTDYALCKYVGMRGKDTGTLVAVWDKIKKELPEDMRVVDEMGLYQTLQDYQEQREESYAELGRVISEEEQDPIAVNT